MINRERLIEAVLGVGLLADSRGDLYGEKYAPHLRSGDGVWQHPEELADFLMFLQGRQVASFLNVGTFNARTFNLMSAYLNSIGRCRCITVDPLDHSPVRIDGYEYVTGTSDDFAGQAFDLVFIDGHHGYAEAMRDYENVGRHARLCAFHDIDDQFIRGDASLDGGVCRAWDELKVGRRTVEFVATEKPLRVMGIGVIIGSGK